MARITPDEALARIQPKKIRARGKSNVKPLQLLKTITNADDDLYIFGNENGSIITPADDSLSPILGIWDEGVDDIPPAMQDMLLEYAKEIEWWQNFGEQMTEDNSDEQESRQTVPMMMETKWAQGSPYNDTIIFEGKKCYTGCNTTAAAQVMYYWGKKGFHRGCPATEEYVTSTNEYTVPALPPLMVFDYKHLVKTPKTAEEKKAVQ